MDTIQEDADFFKNQSKEPFGSSCIMLVPLFGIMDVSNIENKTLHISASGFPFYEVQLGDIKTDKA